MLAEQAIKKLTGKCWVLLTIDGAPDEPAGGAHFASKEKALEGYASKYRRYQGEDLLDVPLLVPVELDQECLTIITACGYVLDEANDNTCHAHDPEVLVSWALGTGWAILPDGRMVCCLDPRACDSCGVLAAEPAAECGPLTGQLTIDGGEVVDGIVLPAVGPIGAAAQFDLAELRRLKP